MAGQLRHPGIGRDVVRKDLARKAKILQPSIFLTTARYSRNGIHPRPRGVKGPSIATRETPDAVPLREFLHIERQAFIPKSCRFDHRAASPRFKHRSGRLPVKRARFAGNNTAKHPVVSITLDISQSTARSGRTRVPEPVPKMPDQG